MGIVWLGTLLGGVFQFLWMLYVYENGDWQKTSSRKKMGEVFCGSIAAFLIGLIMTSGWIGALSNLIPKLQPFTELLQEDETVLLVQGFFGLMGAWSLKISQDRVKAIIVRELRDPERRT